MKICFICWGIEEIEENQTKDLNFCLFFLFDTLRFDSEQRKCYINKKKNIKLLYPEDE